MRLREHDSDHVGVQHRNDHLLEWSWHPVLLGDHAHHHQSEDQLEDLGDQVIERVGPSEVSQPRSSHFRFEVRRDDHADVQGPHNVNKKGQNPHELTDRFQEWVALGLLIPATDLNPYLFWFWH